MAKRVTNKESGPEHRTTGDTITAFAEDLGKVLGTAKAKAEGWLDQRTQIAKTLEGIRDTATTLLSDLGHQAQRITRRGRPKGSGVPGGTRRKMSAAGRAAISGPDPIWWTG